jgi:transcriptional regulator with XRE-family HTH domain
MTSKQVKKRLIDLDLTQAEIARRGGVSKSAICQTIRGRIISARLRRTIAEAMGLPVEKIWPPPRKAA